MKILHSFDEMTINQCTALTVGKFDGLHMGHEILVEKIVKKKKEDFLAVAVTFDRPPKSQISGVEEKLLMTLDEKRAILKHQGVDILIELPFNRDFMRMSPEDFIKNLSEKLHMKYIVVGDDFNFGYKGRGNTKLLQELSAEYGYETEVITKIKSNDRVISSTYIREEIALGHIESANALLGYPYFIIGRIVHGNHIGTSKIGRPTINIIPPDNKVLPCNGVYVTEAVVLGRTFHGVTNVGLRPTVDEAEKKIGVETHIMDFNRDIYNDEAKIVFRAFIRPEKKFVTFEDLKKQIEKDVHTTYSFFNSQKPQMPTIYSVD